MQYLELEDLSSYKISTKLGEIIWKIVSSWSYFEKRTVGIQFVEAIDSVSANIAEGFGRHFKKDKVKFYYYARGSVLESICWLQKAHKRNLLSQNEYDEIKKEIDRLPKDINSLIKFTYKKLTI